MTDITIQAGGRSLPGYLAIPGGEGGRWPGVIVIHEAFGLNGDIRGKADELATHGYLALAPDLFDGKPWFTCVRNAFRQLRAKSGPAFAVLDAAREQLATRPDCNGRVGVIGFCLGGGFALLCAPRPGFDVASVNYGDVPADAEAALAGACPVVGSFGGRDLMGTKPPERLQRALTVLDVPHDIRVYPASGHRFMSQASGAGAALSKITRMSYSAQDAADSWNRIYAYFGRYLSEPASPA